VRIVVVGGGVAGLVAAEILGHEHEVTLLEAAPRLGGHALTLDLEVDGRRLAVDAGFVVHNLPNYPLFHRLLARLGVVRRASDMSFSVRHDGAGVEYAARRKGLAPALFAQRSNLVRPRFWRMLKDLKRLWREAPGWLAEPGPDVDLSERLARDGYGPELAEWHLYPMVAALWSAPHERVRAFPARALATFFHQHGFFRRDRPAWYTVEGGSQVYVERLAAAIRGTLRTSTPVRRVRRHADHVEVECVHGPALRADHVVLALHPDRALHLLDDPTPAEREVLSALPYHDNDVLVHTDTSVLPRRPRAWASWNAWVPEGGEGPATVTYLANRLQRIAGPPWVCISLNLAHAVDPARVLARLAFRHPQAGHAALAARARGATLGEGRRTSYVGAGWGNGFHEDGVRSAVEASARLGAHPRW
jgi:predicted NAD/FAD-binding protein